MPDFDLNAAPSGLAAGSALPNRASGLSDTIKAITNDLRAAASNRQDQAATLRKDALDFRKQNADIFSNAIKKGYRLRDGANAEDLLSKGDLSMLEPPSKNGSLMDLLGGSGQMGAQAQGIPGQQGQGFMGGQSQVGASLQDRLGALGNNTRLLIKDPNGQGSLIVTAPTFQQTVQRKNKETVIRDLEVMQDLFNQVPEAGEGVSGRWEGFKMEVQAKGGYRPELETYNSFKMSMLGRIAGSIGGESGSRLSDQDAARMYGLFPAAWNTPRERLLKWAVFKRAVNSISASYGGANPMYLQMTPEESEALSGLKKGALDKLVKEYNYGPMPTGTRTGKYKNIDTSFADTYLPQNMKQPADQAQINPQEDAALMQEYQQQYGSEE